MLTINQNIGIILRKDYSCKYIIFDRYEGKFHSIYTYKNEKFNICNGSIIEYNLQKIGNNYALSNINVIYVPLIFAKSNILFFHHILELCYFFIPIGIGSIEIFDLIYFLLTSFDKINDIYLQKVYLSKFFLLLGLYPEDIVIKKHFHYILSIPIDRIIDTQIDLINEKELSLWILSCIKMHPKAKSFKTMNFLNKLKYYEKNK